MKISKFLSFSIDAVTDGSINGKLFIVGYRVGNDTRLQQKLASRANSTRLLKGDKNGPGKNNRTIYTGGEYVYMEAMLLE